MNEFAPTSRYAQIERAQLTLADGRTVVFLRRRFVPAADHFVQLQLHQVQDGERLDHIAAKYLSDPEQFWHICDANNAMQPDELTVTIGRKLRITLPGEVQGSPYGQ